MTVLVALSTKDSLVMGCDSLGSVTRDLVDPFDLLPDFFETKDDWSLKVDKEGNPTLKTFQDIYKKAQSVPFNHMPHVTKLFPLDPLEMGVMITGIASIGERTIKSLINEFKNNDIAFNKNKKPANYAVKKVAGRLLKFIDPFYQKEYEKLRGKPPLEFMIGGYDKRAQLPKIFRIFFHKEKQSDRLEQNLTDSFGIAFGGQTQEIERIVFGTDNANRLNIIKRIVSLFDVYKQILQDFLKEKGIDEELPPSSDYIDKLHPFKEWGLYSFDANWGDFSEQNAIDCVNFFVEIMIKSQQFSTSMPTVGGPVHIGLITKQHGFKFISKEMYEHEGFATPIRREK